MEKFQKLSYLNFVRREIGCSSLNADLFSNHVVNSLNCVCGEPETAKHYLLRFRLHDAIRSTTIQQLNYRINVGILFKECPLYDERVNGEIFAAAQFHPKQNKTYCHNALKSHGVVFPKIHNICVLSSTNNPINLCTFCIVPDRRGCTRLCKYA